MTRPPVVRLAAALLVAGTLAGCAFPLPPIRREPVQTPRITPSPYVVEDAPTGLIVPPLPTRLTPEQLALLPEARYDAVIAGLEPYTSATVQEVSYDAYQLDEDTAVYGEDRVTAVARLTRLSFLATPTVIVPVELEPGWAKVLTPARQALPSQNGGSAPAQSAGWIPIDSLTARESVHRRIVVHLSERTLSIEQSAMPPLTWDIGVGTAGTPTPSGVTGYLQARYLDPAQGQSEHPIQLTSLHASNADEPYPGSAGGLIALHFSERSSGEVSHGCLRLDADAIGAVDRLPLGTPITILP